jgi:hypothetical protein
MITESEMSGVLVEFYQRGLKERPPAVPQPPFEIKYTVVQTQSAAVRRQVEDGPEMVHTERSLAYAEKFFDFIPISIGSPPTGGFLLLVRWYFRRHTQGSTGGSYYLRLSGGNYWYSVTPPGYSGGLTFGFNQSTWTPSASDTQGVFVEALVGIQGTPPVFMQEAHALFAIHTEEAGNPSNVCEKIYNVGTIPNWAWYDAGAGIGFNLTFHSV